MDNFYSPPNTTEPISKYPYTVVVYYDGPFGVKGTVLSRHSTSALAERACNRKDAGGFLGIKYIP